MSKQCRLNLVQPEKHKTGCRSMINELEPLTQTHLKAPETSAPIHCSSSRYDSCLIEFFENQMIFNFAQNSRDEQNSTKMGRPNAVVASPNMNMNENDMFEMQAEALDHLIKEKHPIRHRYALVQMSDGIYIIGGYSVDSKTGDRISPNNDFSYNRKSRQLKEIPAVPGGLRLGFGLAVSNKDEIFIVGGHNREYDTLSSVYVFDTTVANSRWHNLADMPNGTIAPGVNVIDSTLYVIGGYDFIGFQSICHGDVLSMDLHEKIWKTHVELDIGRARPLIILDGNAERSLIVAGGYYFDHKGKTVPYGKIERYNFHDKCWSLLSEIPNFKTTSGLSAKNESLFLMDTNFESGETHTIDEFNVSTGQWKNS